MATLKEAIATGALFRVPWWMHSTLCSEPVTTWRLRSEIYGANDRGDLAEVCRLLREIQ